MTFNSAGAYTPAAGALTAAPGQVVQSAVWDAIFTDMTSAFTAVAQSALGISGLNNILSSNGGFEIWQRGAGASASISVGASTTAYTADRWYLTTGANQASTVAAVAGLTSQSQLAGAVTRNSGQTGTTAMTFGYPLDTDEVIRLRGKKVALSFVASTGAGWSPTNGTFTATLYVGTGAVSKRGGGFAGETNVIQISTNLAAGTGATAISGISTATVPTNATQAELQFVWTPVGTASAADTITLDDVCVDPSVMVQNGLIPGYERLPFDLMLMQCKRHFRKSFPYSVAPAQGAAIQGAAALVTAAAAASGFWVQHYPVSLRATAAYTSYQPNNASANALDVQANTSLAVSLDGAGTNSPDGTLIYVTAAASAGAMIAIHWQADAGI
jgi:hypothetical protein